MELSHPSISIISLLMQHVSHEYMLCVTFVTSHFVLRHLISPWVSYTHTEISDNSTGLLHPHRNFGFLHGSLTPTQKFRITPRVSYTHTEFRISPRVSYTHTEIWDLSPGLLHPHRNWGCFPGSLTPTQKFGISPRVSYTYIEIWDTSPGLLHPHRNSGYLPGSLTPTQDLSDTTAGLLHPNFRLLTLGD